LFDLKTFHQNTVHAAETYLKSSDAFAGKDKKTLLEIAKDKERHADIIKSLARLIKENYGKK
jgi:hypothetical protein